MKDAELNAAEDKKKLRTGAEAKNHDGMVHSDASRPSTTRQALEAGEKDKDRSRDQDQALGVEDKDDIEAGPMP